MIQNLVSQASIDNSVRIALAEDIGNGDLTAQLIDAATLAHATLITREGMCLCGTAWFNAVFAQLDAQVQVTWHCKDGDWVDANTTLCTLEGPARALLTGERAAMNFVQLLSGTATTTHRYAALLQGSPTRLLDTRKTIPGLRLAQKYAVRCGGGDNLRLGLYDAFLIKENHIAAAASIAAAIARAHAIGPGKPVEVEVENLDQLAQAIEHRADIIMLDNFDDEQLQAAISLNQNAGAQRVKLEVSGNIDEARLQQLAHLGVDFVSVGALTKHVQAIDLSMRLGNVTPLNNLRSPL